LKQKANLTGCINKKKQYKANVAAIRGFYAPITKEFDGVGDKMALAEKIAEFVAKVQPQ
jgi:hypothetical protein